MSNRNWAMLVHLSVFAGWILPVLGFLAPIIIWQVKKEEIPEVEEHGKEVINFMISIVIYSFISGLLSLIVIGLFMLLALAVVSIVFPIIGAVKASNGELWRYPLIIRLVK